MTHTLSIDRTVATTTSINVPRIDPTTLSLISTMRDAASGVVESWYSLPSGDPLYPSTVVVRVAANPKDKSGTKRCLIALNTFARDEDSVTGDVVLKPISASISLVLPSISLELGDLAVLVGNIYGLTCKTVTTGTPDTVVLNRVLFSITEVFA